MGLQKIVYIRQYTGFTRAGKMQKMYEVTFTTEKTEGEFTFDIPRDEYTPEKAIEQAKAQADRIDAAME